jgi:hypothetical protein
MCPVNPLELYCAVVASSGAVVGGRGLGNEGALANHPQQQLKYGDKTYLLQISSESYRYELYHASGAGSDRDLEFAGLINHSLAVQKADNVTAGVDTALEQLKNSMAAISEFKEANKYASPWCALWLSLESSLAEQKPAAPLSAHCLT